MISVIMGVYNSENYKKTKIAIDSILNQTYKDFEVIICFDGSNDETKNNVYKAVSDDARVKYLYNDKNKGLAYSLNRCLETSNYEYIARMDIDDDLDLNRFKIQFDFLENNKKVDFVSSFALLFDDNGVWGNRENLIRPTKKDFLFNSPFIHGALMIRKKVLESVNGYRVIKETYRMEDYDLWMRLYVAGFRGENINLPLYYIREDKSAMSRRKYKYRIDEMKIRHAGFKMLGLYPRAIPYTLKPLIVGLIPNKLLTFLRGDHR